MSGFITGLTRGGATWTPEFVTGVDAHTCIGCGRCYKVCSRDVFNLVDRADVLEQTDGPGGFEWKIPIMERFEEILE
jgi:Nif-specific ferredoxin III